VAGTDWPQIVALYDVLRGLAPSPVVELNRAVAVAMRDGPAAGLSLLDALADEPRLRGYGPFSAARGDLLARLGRPGEAAAAYREALSLAGTEPERAHLRGRLAEVSEEG
jgi:RNA polymerase sigma-70 factor (ECF subfamily)